jgi:predicted RNase H-like nuclease (RuvC/YqgF family)
MAGSKKDYERELGEINMEIKSLKDTTGRIENKLDKFIDCADKKYATKEELHALRQDSYRQDRDLQWTKEKIFDLALKVASLVSIIGFGSKALGFW